MLIFTSVAHRAQTDLAASPEALASGPSLRRMPTTSTLYGAVCLVYNQFVILWRGYCCAGLSETQRLHNLAIAFSCRLISLSCVIVCAKLGIGTCSSPPNPPIPSPIAQSFVAWLHASWAVAQKAYFGAISAHGPCELGPDLGAWKLWSLSEQAFLRGALCSRPAGRVAKPAPGTSGPP